jgi:phosphoribosyl-AMP cyclohydrolase / phosphoribosyl-ATP pyrophosphohydrolase
MKNLSEKINWEKVNGLVPAIIQSPAGEMLMLGYMNDEALAKTIDTKKVTFFSRTRKELWMKGETSGNILDLISINLDCDNDTLLIIAKPNGPVCHKGTKTCILDSPEEPFLSYLENLIADRDEKRPEGSYVTSLLEGSTLRMAQKVGEEGVEVALASTTEDKDELKGEIADLFFHTLVLMRAKKISLNEITDVLKTRHNK